LECVYVPLPKNEELKVQNKIECTEVILEIDSQLSSSATEITRNRKPTVNKFGTSSFFLAHFN
jgi:hypothetical protein